MKRKYSIGLLCTIVVVIFFFIIVYRISYHKALLDMEEDLIEKQIELDDFYLIKESDGLVTVYYADEETVYEYTTIRIEELPPGIQDELKSGKKVKTKGQVYGFLENYSS